MSASRSPRRPLRRGEWCAAAVPLLVTPLATPLGLCPHGTLRPLEDILTLLTRAGYNGPDALHIYRALFGFLHGHVLNELQELVEKPKKPTTCCD